MFHRFTFPTSPLFSPLIIPDPFLSFIMRSAILRSSPVYHHVTVHHPVRFRLVLVSLSPEARALGCSGYKKRGESETLR
jgi:hypothetical protein